MEGEMLDEDIEARLSEMVDRYVRPEPALPTEAPLLPTIIGLRNTVTIHLHYCRQRKREKRQKCRA
jgi:hypothetical protein